MGSPALWGIWGSPTDWLEITPGDDDLTPPEAITSGAMTPTQARVLERTATSRSAGELGVPGHPLRQGLGLLPGRDLAAVTLAVIRREWVATLFGLSAIFAVITALVSINAPERLWGEFAAVSYTISAVIAVAARRRGPTL